MGVIWTGLRLCWNAAVLAAVLLSPRLADAQGVDAAQRQLLEQAFAREDAGDLRGAIRIYQQVLEGNPKDARAMNSVAGLYGKLGDFEQETRWSKQAIDTDPGFYAAYVNYGNGLAQLGRLDEARAAFEKAAQLEPRAPHPAYSLGVLAEGRRDWKAAAAHYQKAVELDPRFEPGWFSLAAAYANQGRIDEAIVAVKKALELDPDSPDSRAMLAQLEADPRGGKPRDSR
jgi:superkiller protein 3